MANGLHCVRILDPWSLQGKNVKCETWSRPCPAGPGCGPSADEGAPSTQRAEVRILYDDQALYVGARLWDSGRIMGRLGQG